MFTVNYTFNTLDDAQEYADSRLMKLNENSLIEEERESLSAYRPPLELAEIKTAKVDKTSLISVDCVKYSMQKIEKPIDTEPLRIAIENFNRKKREAIDLMLEKIITKDDLKEQTAFYDDEIAKLTVEINNSRNSNAVHQKQIEAVKSFISDVDKTADTDSDNTELYGELVREIIVQENRTVDFYLTCVPFGFRVTYIPLQRGPKLPLACDVLSLSAIA